MITLEDCPLDVAGAPHCPHCGSTHCEDVGQHYFCWDCRKLGCHTARGEEAHRRFEAAQRRFFENPNNVEVLRRLAAHD